MPSSRRDGCCWPNGARTGRELLGKGCAANGLSVGGRGGATSEEAIDYVREAVCAQNNYESLSLSMPVDGSTGVDRAARG